jgi:hypothetical protein
MIIPNPPLLNLAT